MDLVPSVKGLQTPRGGYRDQNAALNIARLGCETLGLKGPGSLGL